MQVRTPEAVSKPRGSGLPAATASCRRVFAQPPDAKALSAERGTRPQGLPISQAVWNRLLSAGLLLGAAGVLAVSLVLPPSPAGFGTHVLLCLPPCMMHYLTGIPCPFCGMTTAFCHLSRGEVAAAFACHVLGPPLYVLTWALGLAGLYGLVTGRAPLPELVSRSRFQRGALYVVLAAWLVQIGRHFA